MTKEVAEIMKLGNDVADCAKDITEFCMEKGYDTYVFSRAIETLGNLIQAREEMGKNND